MNWICRGSLFLLMICVNTFTSEINGQQIGDYNFNNCDFTDGNGVFDDASTIFPPSCDCGLIADGLYFDGSDDHLIFPRELDSLMVEDFTISFYFQLDQATTTTDILSVRGDCDLDSFMALTFNPVSNTLRFDLAQTIATIESREIVLDPNRCWNRVVITKSELFYNLYLNDQLEVSILASNGIITFAKNARLAISNSPCVAVNEDRFNGWIDQFQFYTRALSGLEIIANSLNPDRITSNDTTIVAGSEVTIEVGATCASSFSWIPVTDLDDPTILNPIATPTETVNYTLNILNSNGCQTSDSLTINVIDQGDLDCANLLLPNAFTPNNDQLNDQFGISNLFLVESLEYFQIYDRWGAKIWETSIISDTWDGTFGGTAVNPGMYMYKVRYTCRGNEFVKVDNFSLIR